MYALIRNNLVEQYPYSISQLRLDNPNISFPAEPSIADLEASGVFQVEPISQPTYDYINEQVVETSPQLINNKWTQVWIVQQANQETINERKRLIKQEITYRVQQRLDDFAATRNYGDERTAPIVSACSYASSNHPKYGVEGRYCVEIREQTWDKVYEIEAEVLAGTRPMPLSYSEIEPELPALVWPI